MTNTGHTPVKDGHRGPLTAQEINLLQYKLQVAESRIVELEGRLYGTEYTKYDRIEAFEMRVADLEDEVKAVKSAQRPRPMDEAPRDGTTIRTVSDVFYDSVNTRWRNADGLVVLLCRADGWLPLPDQDEESAS